MIRVELLDRPDAEELAVDPHAEERYLGLEGVIGIEHVHALWRHDAAGKHPVLPEEPTDILAPRIVDLDHKSAHARLLPR
jgi:hypothetical protein